MDIGFFKCFKERNMRKMKFHKTSVKVTTCFFLCRDIVELGSKLKKKRKFCCNISLLCRDIN